HTRGSDMKLRHNARALLTLGPRMVMDSFKQAAGRMRLIERGQRIIIAAPPDVKQQLRHTAEERQSELGPLTVMMWLVDNTIRAIQEGTAEWSNHGIDFFHSLLRSDGFTWPEQLSLHDLYGTGAEISDFVEHLRNRIRDLSGENGFTPNINKQ